MRDIRRIRKGIEARASVVVVIFDQLLFFFSNVVHKFFQDK